MSDKYEILKFYGDLILSGDDELIISVGELEFKLFDIEISIYKPIFKFKSYSPNEDISFSVNCLKYYIGYELDKQLRYLLPDLNYYDIEIYDGDKLIDYDYHFSENLTKNILKDIQHIKVINYNFRTYHDDTVKSHEILAGDNISLTIEQTPIDVKMYSNGYEDLGVEIFLKVKNATMKVKSPTKKEKEIDVTKIIVPLFNDYYFPEELEYHEYNFNEIYHYFREPYFNNREEIGDVCCYLYITTTLVE